MGEKRGQGRVSLFSIELKCFSFRSPPAPPRSFEPRAAAFRRDAASFFRLYVADILENREQEESALRAKPTDRLRLASVHLQPRPPRPRSSSSSKGNNNTSTSSPPPRASTSTPGTSPNPARPTSNPTSPETTFKETWSGSRAGRAQGGPPWRKGCGT